MDISRATRALLAGLLLTAAVTAAAAADPARGGKLVDAWCVECHAVRPGQKSANAKAPAFWLIAAEPTANEYSLRAFLRTSHSTMPNIIIQPDDIADIVDYILSLRAKR